MDKNQPRIHWSQLSVEQIETFLNEAIANKDLELATHWRYILYLKMLNQPTKQINTVVPSVQNPPSVPRLLTPHNIGLPYEQLTDPPAITQPLKDNVFPSALIHNPLVVSLESDDNDIVKLNGLLTQLLGGVNIYHYPAIQLVLDVLLHPKKIEEPPVLSIVLDILKPSSQLFAVGFIQILPEVTPANEVGVPAFITNCQGILTLVQESDNSVP
ncbi:MAG: hypothetical protein EZS28_021759 [Streblomastix strix]|uniref:Uncharacterized protein n=1 Tax=Streblomastix strix TaxID=222440 RepID=A0A5J4VJD3_9EUKA|nr:MAG: hypothetical protein EZS28_021759 [Streblomastix strix]